MRAQVAQEINHVINPVMDALKLRAITTSYKRHTIRRLIRPDSIDPKFILGHTAKLRQSAADYFFTYCRQILPRIEEKIELQLLEKFSDSLGNEAEKKEVFYAYHQRKDNINKQMAKTEVIDKTDRDPRPEKIIMGRDDIARTVLSVQGDGLTYHTVEDIGKYTVFPVNHYKRMFPNRFFGNYEKDEFNDNNTFGIMCREEGLRITNELARLTLPHERQINYEQMIGYETAQMKEEIIKDEQAFLAVAQDFSLDLIDYINSQEDNNYKQELRRLFQQPPVFDGLVSILVQELKKKPIRYHLCVKDARMKVIDSVTRQFHKVMIDKKLNPQKLGDILEHLPLIQIDLERKNLGKYGDVQKNETHQYKLYSQGYHKICYHLWRPEDMRRVSLPRFKGTNTGGLLWGPRGCGKSQILSYVSAWAHENRWMVVAIPACEQYTDGKAETFRHKNGLYLQQDLARELLANLKTSNELLMRVTDVDMSLYGKYDISGVKDGEPEPCPRFWDEERQTWSDSWKENLFDFEIKTLQQRYELMNYRCADKLPNPKKLIELIELGIAEPEVATSCFAELLEQLYNAQKYHVLFAIDGINDWFKPSNYMSFRYDNNKQHGGFIPPHDFALVRLLMKFDGHFVKNGFKLFATTHYRQYKHLCTPDMLNWPDGYHAKVENLALNDFRNMTTYYNLTNWMPDYFKEDEIESWYMETQGNWWAFQQSFKRYGRIHY